VTVNLDSIPAVRAAKAERRERQASSRERAFLGRTHDVCGIKIRAMSVGDFAILAHIKNPLLQRANPNIIQLTMFLWVLSPAHLWWRENVWAPGWMQAVHAWLYAKRCRGIDPEEALLKCVAFVDEMFSDRLSTAGRTEDASVSCEAAWCHAMRSAYGNCSEREVLRMPLPKLFQYLRAIRREKNPEAKDCNRLTDEVANVIMRDLKEKKYTLEELRDGKAVPTFN
jgi:hypothetical protein